MSNVLQDLVNNKEICSAAQAFSVLGPLAESSVEEFWVMALSPTKRVLDCKMLFRGTVDQCLVHPRDVFRFACLTNASSLIVAHNHPSADLRPSHEDIKTTRDLINAGRLLQIPILDHILVTTKHYASFATEGWCRFT